MGNGILELGGEGLIAGSVAPWADESINGSGYGYGYGSGSGDGDGSGSGYGYGYGYGYGDGDGSGYGYGSGDGSGYGYGYGYWRLTAITAISQWGQSQIAKLSLAVDCFVSFWWSDKEGKPSNGGIGNAVQAGDMQTINGPLKLCGPKALHATMKPEKWKGERLWVVALHGEVIHDDNKSGALQREILGEIPLR